jgi:hypothetical protein
VDTVYIETTIPSVYFERRPEPKMVARRQWTRDWWDNQRHRYTLVTGLPVMEELSLGRWSYWERTQKGDVMEPDPLIDEIREVRHRISAQFGHRLVAHYMELEREARRAGTYTFRDAPSVEREDVLVLRERPKQP